MPNQRSAIFQPETGEEIINFLGYIVIALKIWPGLVKQALELHMEGGIASISNICIWNYSIFYPYRPINTEPPNMVCSSYRAPKLDAARQHNQCHTHTHNTGDFSEGENSCSPCTNVWSFPLCSDTLWRPVMDTRCDMVRVANNCDRRRPTTDVVTQQGSG